MSQNTSPPYDRFGPASTPGWGAILVTWAAFVLGPLAILMAVSYPVVAVATVGVIAGAFLSVQVPTVRRLGRRISPFGSTGLTDRSRTDTNPVEAGRIER